MELISKVDFYLSFIDLVKHSKEKPTLTSLESDVEKGLKDIPTLTELAIMTLYREAVSQPYISIVRGLERGWKG